jgi:site-specific DNA-methyltransferase (adenine-specific)
MSKAATKWKTLHSSNKMDWETPQALFDALNERFGPFDLDAAAVDSNKKCQNWLDPNDSIPTLLRNWQVYFSPTNIVTGELKDGFSCAVACIERIWLNPPYGRDMIKWVKKAYEESQKGCRVVCLLPSRTGTQWFKEYFHRCSGHFTTGRPSGFV